MGAKEEIEAKRNRLCENVMNGKWSEVEKMYEMECDELPEVRRAKITLSGATALHIAVCEGREETVRKLVEKMEPKDLMEETTDVNNKEIKEVVLLKDNRGNTPLHLAAKMGNVAMCICIASKAPGLIGMRNNDDETPLFLAALHGKERAFIALYVKNIITELDLENYNLDVVMNHLYQYSRRNSDGRTVLHCAIDGEYFDMAYQIIRRLPDFLHYVDERGYMPFHLLASKHSSFRSSCRLTLLQKLIYPCTPAEKPHVKDDRRAEQMRAEHSKGTDIEKNQSKSNPQRKKLICSPVKHLYAKTVSWLIRGLKILLPKRMVEMKEKHLWAVAIKDILVEKAAHYDYLASGSKPTADHESMFEVPDKSHSEGNEDNPTLKDTPENLAASFAISFSDTKQGIDVARLMDKVADGLVSLEKSSRKNKTKTETPILIAAKNGISEIVKDILDKFPPTIHEMNSEGKNLMLLAVENRQPQVCQLLLEKYIDKTNDDLFLCLDHEGNSALHHAAMLSSYQPWLAPYAVLQMQWEIKWYKFIEENMPKHLLAYQNNEGKTAEDVLMETHEKLLENDREWLMKTSDSCTIVAALIATVAFATSASVPGGSKSNGQPVLKRELMFEVFSISSLGALCFSLTAVVMFLAILTSRHQATNFGSDLPMKLLIGLTALFLSIASVLVSFCGGHFFILKDVLRDARIAEYVVAVIPVTVFAIAQCPLYFRLIWATMKKVPERGFMLTTGGQEKGEPTRAVTKASPKLRFTTSVAVNEQAFDTMIKSQKKMKKLQQKKEVAITNEEVPSSTQ